MKNFVLVFPRFRYPTGDIPYGIASIASYLRENLEIDVSIWDATFNPSTGAAEEFLRKKSPLAVGISVNTIMYKDALKIAELAKKLDSFVFVGGPHATMLPETLIKDKNIDAVVIGEGEETALEIAENLLNGEIKEVAGAWVKRDDHIFKGAKRKFISDLDKIPFPAWDLLDMEKYLASWYQLDSYDPSLIGTSFMASRGCPYNCSFCQPILDNLFGHKVRFRSPSSCIGEIKELINRYKIKSFWLLDDSFTCSKPWVRDFCNELKSAKINLPWGCTTRANLVDEEVISLMAEAGLVKIGIGIESASPRIINEVYNKQIALEEAQEALKIARKHRVKTMAFFMLGAPSETREEIQKTIDFAASLEADDCTFSLFVPIPGTNIYNKMLKDGVKLSDDYSEYEYYSKQPFEGEIPVTELRKLQRLAFFKFYSKPGRWGYLLRTISSKKGIKTLALKLKRII